MKKILEEVILNNIDALFELTKRMYDEPEIGNEEFKSSKMLVECLNENEFETKYPYIMPTGFLGTYKSKKKGPKIGFLCEYDALPVVGHGCGHNLICTISILAAIASKKIVDELGGELYVFGTPAEENFGGKCQFANEKAFEDLDIAMMLHPSTKNALGSKSFALIPLKFDFNGTSAHACKPYNGRSALDAAVLTYTGIDMQRQFFTQPSFCHGIFRDGGGAANVIPEHASLEYYFRSPTMKYCLHMVEKAKEQAKGAAIMTGTTVSFSHYEESYDDTLINYTLADALGSCFREIGLEFEGVDETPSGSTDVGACSKQCPTIQGSIKIAPSTVNAHSKEMACATVSSDGFDALKNGALALSLLCERMCKDSNLRDRVKKEFEASL